MRRVTSKGTDEARGRSDSNRISAFASASTLLHHCPTHQLICTVLEASADMLSTPRASSPQSSRLPRWSLGLSVILYLFFRLPSHMSGIHWRILCATSFSFSPFTKHTASLRLTQRTITTMSFDTTATINSFGGKLLKLQHKVALLPIAPSDHAC